MIVGSDFEVNAILTNNCMETRTCTFLFYGKAVGYNGKLGDSCGFTSDKVEVPSGGGQLSIHLGLHLLEIHRNGFNNLNNMYVVLQKHVFPSKWSMTVMDQPSPLTG